jgi:hypothetical protein
MLMCTKETFLVGLTCQNVGGGCIRTCGLAQWIHTQKHRNVYSGQSLSP